MSDLISYFKENIAQERYNGWMLNNEPNEEEIEEGIFNNSSYALSSWLIIHSYIITRNKKIRIKNKEMSRLNITNCNITKNIDREMIRLWMNV